VSRRLTAGLVVSVAIATTATAQANALVKGFWGPARVNGVSQFPIYRKLGVGLYQTALSWSSTAPTRPAHPTDPDDPAYRWPPEMDDVMKQARRHRMRVLLMVIGSPSWANGGNPSNYAPDSASYADFVTAAAKRYPAVRHWMIWGEPTRRANYEPLATQTPGVPLTREQREAPHRYARMLDRAYGALKAVSKRNLVIGGNSFTAGDIRPAAWARNLRLRNGRPPRMDLYGHNPFCLRPPDLDNPPGPAGISDFSDLRRFQRVVDRSIGRKASPKYRRKRVPLFLSEWTVPTGPDREFSFYADPRTQRRFIRRGFSIARKLKVYGLGWVHLYDEPADRPGGRSQGGLLYADGRRKPGFAAFARG
jgi:hypothetical protein